MAIQGNLPGIVALLEQDLNLVSLQVGNLERDVYHCHHRSKIVFRALYRELAAHDHVPEISKPAKLLSPVRV